MNEAGRPIFVITGDLAQYAIKHVQFNAELIGKKRRFGFNVYYNKGLSPLRDPETYKRKEVTINPVADGDGFYKSYYWGVDAKFYPKVEVKRFKYYYSFGLEFGESSCRIEKENTYASNKGTGYYYYTSSGSWVYGTSFSAASSTAKSINYYTNPYWGFHHKQGCLWTITDWLYLEAELNVGLNRFLGPEKDSDGKLERSNSIKFGGGLHLGFAL
jgi:hypothetical protein